MNHHLNKQQFNDEFRTPEVVIDAEGQSYATRGLVANTQGAATVPQEIVASYLNKRLYEIGVRHVFAIPGDYIAEWVETLDMPDYNPDGLIRQHPNNEMCAGYAADGYGRSGNGKVGCVAFTYGVGALNSVNAIAGAFVENVPVIMINGTPSRAQFNSQRDQGILWHHMFDGSGTDKRVLENVTEMAVTIDNPATAPALIDTALRTCITESKPVYIEIAVGMEFMPCEPVPATPLVAVPVPQAEATLNQAVEAVYAQLQSAESLIVMGGVEIARAGIQDDFKTLVQALNAPYMSSLLGKSVLSEYDTDINFSGVFNGKNSQQNVQDLALKSDCILNIGVDATDFNLSGLVNADSPVGTPLPTLLSATRGAIKVSCNDGCNPDLYWGDIQVSQFVPALLAKIQGAWTPPVNDYPQLVGSPWDIPEPDQGELSAAITWDSFKQYLHHHMMEEGDVLLADTGLTFYGMQNVKVASNGYVAQLSWGSIGYSVAANYGVGLSLRDSGSSNRAITVSGDGAFSESINALGTIAQLDLGSIVFVMNNKVFAIEQWLVDPTVYADGSTKPFLPLCEIPQGEIWDYVKLAEGFGGQGFVVNTNQQLRDAMNAINADYAEAASGSGTSAVSPFYLVSVEIEARDIPSNTRWKVEEAQK